MSDRYSNHDGEHCQSCGRPYDLVWVTDDTLWASVVGRRPGGLRCPDCFHDEARAAGVEVVFTATPMAERDALARRMDAVRALCEDAIERRQQYAERGGPSHAGLDAVALFAVDALVLLDGEAGE